MVEKSNNKYFSEIIRDKEKYFDFGCQGSDLFFYNFSTPWRGPVLGKRMHYEMLEKAFWQAIEHGKNNSDSPETLAFLTGYLSHYLVDRYLHAFILARSANFTMHKCLENEIDSFLLEHFKGTKARNVNPFNVIEFNNHIPAEIIGFFQTHLREIYAEEKGNTALENSYRDFKYLQSALFSPGPVKRAVLRAANTVIPYNVDSLLYEAGDELLWEEEKRRFLTHYEQTLYIGADILAEIFAYWRGSVSKSSLAHKLSGLDLYGPDSEEIVSTLPDSQKQQRLIS